MFGLGSICDKIADEILPEEYRWLADIGCAGIDIFTGNWGNAAYLGIKAAQDGAAASGNKDLAENIGTANAVQGVVSGEILNVTGANAMGYSAAGQKLGVSLLKGAGAAGAGAAIGVAKGGSARDIREGVAIGAAGVKFTADAVTVKWDPPADAKTLLGNASLLGRDTVALGTAVAVAAKDDAAGKRTAGAVGAAIGAAADLPGASVSLTEEEAGLRKLMTVERTAQDLAAIVLNAEIARLRCNELGKDLQKAAALTGAGLDLARGTTEEFAKPGEKKD